MKTQATLSLQNNKSKDQTSNTRRHWKCHKCNIKRLKEKFKTYEADVIKNKNLCTSNDIINGDNGNSENARNSENY